MRLLFEVDCHDVHLVTAFLWKSFLTKFTHEASLWGGLLWCALGDSLSLVRILPKNVFTERQSPSLQSTWKRSLMSVSFVEVLLENVFPWKSFLANFTLMRLLFEVDCHDVLLENVFPWKSFLANFTLMSPLFEVDCCDVPLESGGLPWYAFGDCLLRKIVFGKIYTHEASLWGGLL